MFKMADRPKTKRLAPPLPSSKSRPPRQLDASLAKDLYSHKHLLVLTHLVDPQIDAEMYRLQNKRNKTVADIVLLCLLRFRQIRSVMQRIPKSADAWLNVQLQMIKRKMGPMKYLSDKDIKKIIIHVRQINASRHPEVTEIDDPDLPSCFYWNVEQVGHWLTSTGYAHLKEMFQNNFISGRKLITVDASALSRMGMKYFQDIQILAAKIRDLLKIPKPNMMRALMCKVPFEHYLNQRQWSGESYDQLTFKKFCEDHGYPYHFLQKNPLAIIECTRDLTDYLGAFAQLRQDGDSPTDGHMVQVTSVEFTVRHILVRDKVVSALIDQLLDFGGPNARSKYGVTSLSDIFLQGFEELGISPADVAKRMEFGRLIAEEMLNEVLRTQRALQDLSKFKEFLKHLHLSDEQILEMQGVANEFFASAANVATLLALGELDLETIFAQEPEFNAFVDGIVEEAETTLNEMVPDAEEFIDEVIKEALSRVEAMEFPHLQENTAEIVKDQAKSLLSDMAKGRILSVDEVKRRKLDDDSPTTQRGAKTVIPRDFSPKSPRSPLGNTLSRPTVGFFSVEIDPPKSDLARKLGGGEQPSEITVHEYGPSGDTVVVPSSQRFKLSDSVASLDHSLPTDSVSNYDTRDLLALVLDHVVNEVVQEALTQMLDETSANETKQIIKTLEEHKEARKSQVQLG